MVMVRIAPRGSTCACAVGTIAVSTIASSTHAHIAVRVATRRIAGITAAARA